MNLTSLLACSTCSATFGASGDSIGYSIFFLLVLILAVLAGVAFFMFRLIRRDAENLDPELRDDYAHQ
jgi:hypothetical protein